MFAVSNTILNCRGGGRDIISENKVIYSNCMLGIVALPAYFDIDCLKSYFYKISAIEIPGGNRSRVINIIAQQITFKNTISNTNTSEG